MATIVERIVAATLALATLVVVSTALAAVVPSPVREAAGVLCLGA